MAVYYRYRSGVDTFSVPVAAPTISVADLKRLILGTTRHGHGRTRGRGPRESVALSDARTGEEYADDDALIPRSSTVVVRRVAGPPAETITVAPPSPKATSTHDSASSGSAAARSGSTAQDDEDRAISAAIDAAQLTWEGYPSQGRRAARALQEQRTPPAGYVCHRCRVPGHFIQHCPTNGDPRFDFGRASSATNLPAPAPAPTVPDDGIPPEFHCRMCKKVMADAVVTGRCCFDSFCDACIRGRIVADAKCGCGAPARADDLVPNQTLRVTIANMLAARAATGGADNQKTSSAGSNEKPCTSQSPDASRSQGSRSQVTAACSEHSDGSTSSSTSKIAAAVQPRTKQATMGSTQVMASGGYPEQYGCAGPFGPALYDPVFGAMPWAPDPYTYYGVPFAGGYPIAPVPAGYHDGGGHGRKRTADGEGRRRDEPGLKRMCRSRSLVAV